MIHVLLSRPTTEGPNQWWLVILGDRQNQTHIDVLISTLNQPKNKIRATLILYPDLDEEKCIDYWSKKIALPKSQFYKTQFIKGKHPTKRLSWGICMLGCGSGQLKEKLLLWIDLMSKTL